MYQTTPNTKTPLLPELAHSHWTTRAAKLEILEKNMETSLALYLASEFEDQIKLKNYLSKFDNAKEWNDLHLMSQEAEIVTSFLLSFITGLQIPINGKFDQLRHDVRKFILNSAMHTTNPERGKEVGQRF